MANTIEVSSVDPRDLSHSDVSALAEVTQDMWAYGIGEFVRCDGCQKVYGKKDIFGHLPREVYMKTVAKIMKLLDVTNVDCPCCGGKTEFIYGREFIDILKKKLIENVYSVLVLARNDEGIIGYMDGYIADFDTLYKTDIGIHYAQFPCSVIRTRVEELLQRKVDEMIFFSEAGFVQNYSGLSNFFALYRKLFGSFDEKYHRTPGITELDTSNTTLFRIYERMGSKVAHFDQSRIVETHPGYSSSLAVFDSPVHDFTTKFDMPAKEFIRNFMK